MALPLYVAVSTDTGCFAYANATAETHRGGGRADARPALTIRTVNKRVLPHQEPQVRMQLEAAILNGLRRFTTETGWRCCPCPSP